MRNSEAQKYARWSLAAAGLLAAAVAGVYGRNVWLARQAEKKAPPAVPPTVEQRSNEFSYSKVEGQRTIYTVRASHTTEFKKGEAAGISSKTSPSLCTGKKESETTHCALKRAILFRTRGRSVALGKSKSTCRLPRPRNRAAMLSKSRRPP